jgi:hypothetical protein
LKYCTDNDIGGLGLAFGYETLAKAYMVAGNHDLINENFKLAKEAAELIENEDNKNYFLSELNTISA